MPEGRVSDPEALFTGWMLLSYRAAARASSTTTGFPASAVTDENPRTFWVAGANRAGETLTLDLGGARTLRAVQVNFADYKSGRYDDAPDIYTDFRLEASDDGTHWRPLAATGADRRDRPNAYFELPAPVRARYVRYVHGHVGAANLAISDLRVFGSAGERAPTRPADVTVTRDRDPRQAVIRWKAVPGAVGYNVRWGLRPDRLALTYQVWADQAKRDGKHLSLDLRALDVGQRYVVAVEAFNASAVSPLSRTARM
jgi:xylan 1,4-beta-xylosidase